MDPPSSLDKWRKKAKEANGVLSLHSPSCLSPYRAPERRLLLAIWEDLEFILVSFSWPIQERPTVGAVVRGTYRCLSLTPVLDRTSKGGWLL